MFSVIVSCAFRVGYFLLRVAVLSLLPDQAEVSRL